MACAQIDLIAPFEMQPRFFTAILLFISSYAPLGVILIALDFDWEKHLFEHPAGVAAIGAISLLAWIIPFAILRRLPGGENYEIVELNDNTGGLVSYALPYLVVFIGLKLDKTSDIVAFILFMALLCSLTVQTKALWINPVLALAGFRLYESIIKNDSGRPFSVSLLARQGLVVGNRCTVTALTAHQLYVTGPYETPTQLIDRGGEDLPPDKID